LELVKIAVITHDSATDHSADNIRNVLQCWQ